MYTESIENERMPLITKRPACENDIDGKFTIDWIVYFPKSAREFWGDTNDYNLHEMNWLYVKSYSYVKDGEVITVASTDTYPIFARKCYYETEDDFTEKFLFKMYEPYAIKQYRYRYIGNLEERPQRYINGLHELKKEYQKYNRGDGRNSKVNAAAFCTGEKQAMLLKSLDIMPLWFNSETYKVNQKEINEIRQYVSNLYFIPKVDLIDMNTFEEEMALLSI